MKHIVTVLFLFLFSGLIGCSDQYVSPDEPHPVDYLAVHGEDSGAQDDADNCKVCHGNDYQGTDKVIGCLDCHLEGPPFTIHPQTWGVVTLDHQDFAVEYSWTGCATDVCHGEDLRGSVLEDVGGPSCFSTFGCHEDGPPPAHGLPFNDPAEHGMSAKNEQDVCLNCHGRPETLFDGGFVADPDILNLAVDCRACHTAAQAHPTNWQGDNDGNLVYYATHRDIVPEAINAACVLCHAISAPAPEGHPAPSCQTAVFTNADGSTSACHAAD